MKKIIVLLLILTQSNFILSQVPTIQESKGEQASLTIDNPFFKSKPSKDIKMTDSTATLKVIDIIKNINPKFLNDFNDFNDFKNVIDSMKLISQDSLGLLSKPEKDKYDFVENQLVPLFSFDFKGNILGYNKKYLIENYGDSESSKLEVSTYHLSYYRNQAKAISSQIDVLEKQLFDGNTSLSKDDIDDLVKEVKEKRDSLDNYNKIIKEIESKRDRPGFMFPSFKKKRLTFNTLYSEIGNQNFYFVKNATFQFNDNGGVAESELVATYLGPTRVTMGSIVANSNSEKEEGESEDDEVESSETEAFQRLIAGGGNLYLNLELPIFLHQTRHFLFYVNGNARLNLDIAEFSNDIDTSTGNGNVKSSIYLAVSSDDNVISLFGNLSYGYYFGHETFMETLNIKGRKDFGFGQLTAGITVSNKFRIGVTLNTFSNVDSLDSGKVIIGAQILSGLFKN